MKSLALIAALLSCIVAGCGRPTNAAGETIILQWTDAITGNHYEVATRPRSVSGGMRSTLYVRTLTSQRSVQIDDDAAFGTAALIREGEWILVANDDDVLAGYDAHQDLLVGEGEVDRLPYTIGAGAKTPLVAAHVSEHSDRPASFVARAATKPTA